MARYRIAHGSVRNSLPEGEKLLQAGEELELDDETAQRLGDQVVRLPGEPPVSGKPAKGKASAAAGEG